MTQPSRSPHRRRGRRDQAARAALAPLVEAGLATCARCHRPIRPGEAWDAGHLEDLVTGGDPDGTRVPEHSRCNRGAGAVAGNRRRGRAARRLRPDFFLEARSLDTPRVSLFLPQDLDVLTQDARIAISPNA